MPAFVSTHSLPLREHYLFICLAPKQRGVLIFLPAFILSVLFPKNTYLYLTHFQSNCRYRVGVQKLLELSQCSPHLPLSLCFCVSFSLAFRATPGCTGSGVTAGMKKGWLLWASRQKPVLFKSAQWVRPNCLHVLLTPSELQTSTQRQRQVWAKGLVA